LGLLVLASGNIVETVLVLELPIVAFTNLAGTIILSFAVIRSQAMLPARQRSNRLKQEIANSKQTEKHLTKLFKEKEVLLREVHHRVKNTFQVLISLLNLQRNASDDSADRNATAEISKRVYSMALVHEKIYRTDHYSGVAMNDYLKSIAHELRSETTNQRHAIVVQAGKISLAVDQAVYAGMLVYELVKDIMAHDFAADTQGTVSIKLEQRYPDKLMLEVSSQGTRGNSDLRRMNRNELGFHLVNILLQELEAAVVPHPKQKNRFQFTFPAVKQHGHTQSIRSNRA
jgi:two-component sensor histidine kinase